MYHVKRPRSDDDDDGDWCRDAACPSVKRCRADAPRGVLDTHSASQCVRALPFRSSPTSQHSSLFSSTRQLPKPPALTPAESDSSSSSASSADLDLDLDLGLDPIEFRSPTYPPKPAIPTVFRTDADLDDDDDDDMADAQPLGSPLWSPKSPHPNRLLGPAYPSPLLGAASLATRIPTPIYGHFGARPPLAAPGGNGGSNLRPASDLRLNHRMPSPICEAPSVESPTTAGLAQHLATDLAMGTSPAAPTFAAAATAATAAAAATTQIVPPWSPSAFGRRKSSGAESGGTSCSRSSSASSAAGRRRSDAVSGGERRNFVFAMGFRADCDKCRERVPGHYSHVLRV